MKTRQTPPRRRKRKEEKEIDRSPAFQRVAINGSLLMGIGNTGLMIQIVRQGLELVFDFR